MIWAASGKRIHNFFFFLPDNLPISVLWYCALLFRERLYIYIYIFIYLFIFILPTVSRRELVPSISPGFLGSKHRDAIKCAEILQEEMLM